MTTFYIIWQKLDLRFEFIWYKWAKKKTFKKQTYHFLSKKFEWKNMKSRLEKIYIQVAFLDSASHSATKIRSTPNNQFR